MIPPYWLGRTAVLAALVAVVVAHGHAASALGPTADFLSAGSVQQGFDPSVYLPSADEITSTLNGSVLGRGNYVAVSVPAPASSWNAAARYVIQFSSGSPRYVFDIAASVYPTANDAAAAVDQAADGLLAANSPSREYPLTPQDWVGHAREVRYDFTDPDTGNVRGSYTWLISEGCALAMVNAQGDPNTEFRAPAVDNDRALLLGVISQEMDGNLRATPVPCSGQ